MNDIASNNNNNNIQNNTVNKGSKLFPIIYFSLEAVVVGSSIILASSPSSILHLLH